MILFFGMLNPLLGLGGIVVLFFAFRGLFHYRARVVLRRLVESSTKIRLTAIEITARRLCPNCNLWNDGTFHAQCGTKLDRPAKA